jgi:hypothetical protein
MSGLALEWQTLRFLTNRYPRHNAGLRAGWGAYPQGLFKRRQFILKHIGYMFDKLPVVLP